jgi:hypothetical protein
VLLDEFATGFDLVAHQDALSSKQRFKAGGREMQIVCERLCKPQSAHRDKRRLVNNSCTGCLAVVVCRPRRIPFDIGEDNETSYGGHVLTQLVYLVTIGPACGGVSAFEQHCIRRYAFCTRLQ